MLRILVADDCRDTAESFAELMTAWGHEAEAAYDGPSALKRAAATRPDVVLLDYNMPGLHGAEVARRIRAAGPSRPWLVAVSGAHPSHLSQEDVLSFDCRLDKPVNLGDLSSLLRALGAADRSAS